ncbi:MAG TPA: sigma factor-like helix-turn-helix DNA-binding protein [Kofleriaceae bacterium]
MNDDRDDEDVELDGQDGAGDDAAGEDTEDDGDGDGDGLTAGGEQPPEVSRKVRRRRRRTRPRSKTIAMKRLTREELRQGALMYPPVDIPRPTSRAECREELRPCPWVACKHHLYLDINPETGSIKINFPDLEPWELKHTCALDVAERGGITLEEVGEIMNLTRERIRQVEVRGLLKLKMGSPSPDELGADLLAGKDPLADLPSPSESRTGRGRQSPAADPIAVGDPDDENHN